MTSAIFEGVVWLSEWLVRRCIRKRMQSGASRASCAVIGGAVVVFVTILGRAWLLSGAELPLNAGFTVRQEDDTYWLIQPGGERFFSLGVCCVNQGIPQSEWNPANPGYAAWRYYRDSNAWACASLERLKAWGFTTIGGWSDFQALRQGRGTNLLFTPVLHIGATAGAPWWDMWDPKTVERMDRVARHEICALRDDPRVIGYYTDNEIGWWNAILFKSTLEQAPGSGQRQRLIQFLRQTYRDDWSAMMRDFETAPILESWAELERHGMLYLRPGGHGIHVERQFIGVLAERYYSLMQEMVRKYHPQALILGDRFPGFYYPEVVCAGAPYVDAVSYNLNPMWNDGTFPRFSLETLHKLSGKPLIICEFYLAARENGSGNKNSHGTYPVAATQKERATGFLNTIQRLLNSRYVIGADWFQYYDQPTHGRFDGENFDFGLVDIHDKPYGLITSTAAALNLAMARVQPPHRRLDSTEGVPPAPREPFANFEPGLALKHWDRERGFVRPASDFPLADLYVCWNRRAIYLGLCAQDVVEDVFYRGKTVLASERGEWSVFVKPSGQRVQGRIGAGMEPVFDEPSAQAMNLSGIDGNTRNIAALELPAKLFSKRQFKPGDAIEFSSTFLTHGRAYRVEWNANLILRGK